MCVCGLHKISPFVILVVSISFYLLERNFMKFMYVHKKLRCVFVQFFLQVD